MCCGASFFFLRRDDDDEVVCETTLLYLYTKIVDLSRRVFVFFLGVGSFSFRFVLMALFVLCYLFPVFIRARINESTRLYCPYIYLES